MAGRDTKVVAAKKKPASHSGCGFFYTGAAEGTRTPDPIITNDVLYQLSYSGVGVPLAVWGAACKAV